MGVGEVSAPGVVAVQNVGEEDAPAHDLATTLHVQALAYHALGAQLNLGSVTLIAVQVSKKMSYQ